MNTHTYTHTRIQIHTKRETDTDTHRDTDTRRERERERESSLASYIRAQIIIATKDTLPPKPNITPIRGLLQPKTPRKNATPKNTNVQYQLSEKHAAP